MTNKYLEKIAEETKNRQNYSRIGAALGAGTVSAIDQYSKLSSKIKHPVLKGIAQGIALGTGLSVGHTAGWKLGEKKDLAKHASDTKSDLRDTAVIGGVGALSSVATHHTVSSLEGSAKKILPQAERVGGSILKRVGQMAKSPAAKYGAIGGAIGLVGDYAAVKANKALGGQTKEASTKNLYLEKIAEHYSIKPHSWDKADIKNISLNRSEMDNFSKIKSEHITPKKIGSNVATGGILGAVGGAWAGHVITGGRSGKKLGAIAGGVLGAAKGLKKVVNEAHETALEKMKFSPTHRGLKEMSKEYK